MKLNIYKNQKEIAKTYEVDTYDLMYGTVEDICDILDSADALKDTKSLGELIKENRSKLEELLLDIFGGEGLTRDELRKIKVAELLPLFVELFTYVRGSFQTSGKN